MYGFYQNERLREHALKSNDLFDEFEEVSDTDSENSETEGRHLYEERSHKNGRSHSHHYGDGLHNYTKQFLNKFSGAYGRSDAEFRGDESESDDESAEAWGCRRSRSRARLRHHGWEDDRGYYDEDDELQGPCVGTGGVGAGGVGVGNLLSRAHNTFWRVFPFTEHGFHHWTTKSENINNTFLRLVKIMEEFVFGLEVFLKCVENITLLCRGSRLNP